MTDDPNKKQNDPTHSGQSGQHPGQQSGQQQRNPDDKRPSQGGTDKDKDRDQKEQGGQRRAS
ncbi:MAG: hypothetical protein WAN03_07535 [Candidatus Sulfotelmatobacter sp.]